MCFVFFFLVYCADCLLRTETIIEPFYRQTNWDLSNILAGACYKPKLYGIVLKILLASNLCPKLEEYLCYESLHIVSCEPV